MGAIRKSEMIEQRFSLRLPSEQLEAVDELRRKRAGCVSRNTWIAEAIAEKLRRDAAAKKAGANDT